ncbi:MAG: Carboxynorspermidine dehydrogenase [Candidatus Ozemobacter sibiricus]|uniref:Carboxynorspermidine dehydrogenase n=1 Tax=Candidatus Ozemobacter sibiricus TaxID=2268124 RepID=A0A367ZTF6_9BACT|nr:MAG: Carboxynorspermidine dehydrogenase [Candidatus Ozemobacter sibiricus]
MPDIQTTTTAKGPATATVTGGLPRPRPAKVVFFGLGAVGSAMLICLSELAERDGVPIRFVVYVRSPEAARDALFHAERLFDRIDFVGLPEFDSVFALEPKHEAELAGATLLVNAALPRLNDPIMELALQIRAHTLDLASDMYDAETERTLTFSQYRFDQPFREKGLVGLINMGISPGVTNYLIGRRLHELRKAERKDLEIESVDLFLLEDIDSDSIVFSWSPIVALEELAQRPRILYKGRMQVLEPFSQAREYLFPHEPRPCRQYPLYQEELLSLRRSFPEIDSIAIYTGGSEVELVKALYQLNLLSKRSLPNQPELTVEAMVRAILPGMNKPRRIEEYLRNGVIRRAHFAAAAEIRVSETVRNERQTVIETVGLSYLRYRELLNSPYAGATYISYPTAVGAAILAWHALETDRGDPSVLNGILTGEDLARLMSRARADAIRRDLVAWDIDLFESLRDASET